MHKSLVEGPMAYIHMRHPRNKKEIILCSDFHRHYDGCAKAGISFTDWVLRTAKSLPSKEMLDLFVENQKINVKHKLPQPYGPNDQGFLFHDVNQRLETLRCVRNKTKTACKRSLSKRGVHNLRVHSVDSRFLVPGLLDILRVIRQILSSQKEKRFDANLLDKLETYVLSMQNYLRPRKTYFDVLYKPAKSFGKPRSIEGKTLTTHQFLESAILVCSRLTTIGLPQVIDKHDDIKKLFKGQPKTSLALLKRFKKHTDLIVRTLASYRKLPQKLQQMELPGVQKLLENYSNRLISFFNPQMDIYVLSRLFKPYVHKVIYYAGHQHILNLVAMLYMCGFKSLSDTSQHIDLNLIVPQQRTMSFESGIREIVFGRNYKAVRYRLPKRASIKWQQTVRLNGKLGLIYEDFSKRFFWIDLEGSFHQAQDMSQCLLPPQFKRAIARPKPKAKSSKPKAKAKSNPNKRSKASQSGK